MGILKSKDFSHFDRSNYLPKGDEMKVEFLGACRGVTGSKHLLTTAGGTRVLIDCGLFQGRRSESREKNRNFPFDPKGLDAVVLGHAHIDHSGNLPNLVRKGYHRTIYATEPTDGLCHYMLPDSGYLQEKDAEFVNKKHRKRGLPLVEPIYNIADAMDAIRLIKPYPLGEWIQIADDVEIKFFDAGHILGSALTLFKIREPSREVRLAYIVDLGRKDLPLLRDPEQIRDVDYAIIESTYGNRVHEPIEIAKDTLADTINRTYERGGKIIIPSFAVERTQEILYFLNELELEKRIPTLPVFIDSPLAVNITELFPRYISWFDEETQNLYRDGNDPFDFAKVEYVRSVDRSKELNQLNSPALIISASGMAEAGRILHHLANNIENSRNTVLIVGFMAENTLGRKLADGWKEVPILGDKYKVRAEVVVSHSFSAHADKNELLEYLKNIGSLKKLFIVHGEETQALEFALLVKDLDNIEDVYVPKEGDVFEA